MPGTSPALGGPWVAWLRGGFAEVASPRDLRVWLRFRAPGADKLAVSARWLVYRVPGARGDAIYALHLPDGRRQRAAHVRAPAQLGRPALSGEYLVYHVGRRHGGGIRIVNLRRHRRRWLVRDGASQALNPSMHRGSLLYVRITRCGQTLRLRRVRTGRERVLRTIGPVAARDAGHDPGHTTQGSEPSLCYPERPRAKVMFWTTALADRGAYVSVFGGGRRTLLRYAR